MCLQKIKEFVVGQYQSYKDLSLERQVAELEKELLGIKTSQLYLGSQIWFNESIGPTISSKTGTGGGQWGLSYPYVFGEIIVTGLYKNKALMGQLVVIPKFTGLATDWEIDFHDTYYQSGGGGDSQKWIYCYASIYNDAPSGQIATTAPGSPFDAEIKYYGNMPVSMEFRWLA